ncbi:transketolase [Clostridium cadaveris]|uniref:transketolase n=1 Tax=Clostridium cadaveris TaxID=1529 RepID=UPI0039A26E30
MNREEILLLEEKAKRVRRLIIKEIASIGTGHVGGSLSAADALVLLYNKVMNIDVNNPKMEGRDRFVLSKGHAGAGLYAVLCEKGYITEETLYTLNQNNTTLPSHCDMNKVNGIDMTTGSLGQGFSAAVGMALAAKIAKEDAYIYTMVGDGECQEGQIWEAALAASSFKLNNLIGFVDYNKLQLDGPLKEIIEMSPMDKKWEAFGCNVIDVDGHNMEEMYNAIMKAKECKDKPSMIILNTIKGKGVKSIEAQGFKNHSMTLTEEIVKEALEELK